MFAGVRVFSVCALLQSIKQVVAGFLLAVVLVRSPSVDEMTGNLATRPFLTRIQCTCVRWQGSTTNTVGGDDGMLVDKSMFSTCVPTHAAAAGSFWEVVRSTRAGIGHDTFKYGV